MLVPVFAAETARRIPQHYLDLSFGGKVPHTLEARPLQGRSAIAVIFEDPLFGDLQIVILGELDQRRRLTRNRVRLPLLLGRHPCVDRRYPHVRTPLHCRQRAFPEWPPKACSPGPPFT